MDFTMKDDEEELPKEPVIRIEELIEDELEKPKIKKKLTINISKPKNLETSIRRYQKIFL